MEIYWDKFIINNQLERFNILVFLLLLIILNMIILFYISLINIILLIAVKKNSI